jgi:hypothetical protein
LEEKLIVSSPPPAPVATIVMLKNNSSRPLVSLNIFFSVLLEYSLLKREGYFTEVKLNPC